jgi:Signal transduction histidine kinase
MGDFKKGFVLLTTVGIILLFSFYLLFVTLNISYVGIAVEKNQAGIWQIANVDHLGWAEQQGIKVGDVILTVNENQPGSYYTIQLYGIIEQAETLTINRNGELILYKVTNNMTPGLVLYHIVIPTVVFVILFFSSLFLYLRKSDDKSALILILFFLAIGFSYLSAPTSSRIDIPGLYINRISLLLIPVFFLEFLNSYFKSCGISLFNRKLLLVFYLVNCLLLIINTIFQILGRNLFIIRYCFLAVFSISILVCLYILISCYIRYMNTVHKPVFKTIIVGFILAFFPFVVLVGFPSILFGVELIPGALAAVFSVFIPIVFLYLITANRLFDIDFIIDRIRYYSLLSLIPTVLFELFLFYFKREFTLVQRIQIALVTYTGIIAFLYLKEELDFRFSSKLFSEKYNFQASLNRFSHDIVAVMKTSDLEEKLIREVKEVLAVKSVSLLTNNMTDYSLGLIKGSQKYPDKVIADWLKNSTGLITVGELIDIGSDGVFLIVSKTKDRSHLLWIREKLNRTRLNHNERVWLKTIAFYVSIVYENLHLIEGLMEKLEEAVSQKDSAHPWVSRLLFNLAEKERRRLATDLHDFILQNQLLFYRNLEKIAGDKRMPVDLSKQLLEITEELLDVIHQIRETCNELRPPFLKEMGIIEALTNLFANAQLRNDFVVNFEATGLNIYLDYEHVLTLYRIAQELLTNAAKHSKANEIHITLVNSNGTINFNYRDNGIGMDLKNLLSSLNHMGLSGIRERVSSLEGKASFNSSIGQGFEVSIWLPLDMNYSSFEQEVG